MNFKKHSETSTACSSTRSFLSGLTPLFQAVTNDLYQRLFIKLADQTSIDDAFGFYDELMKGKSEQHKSKKDFIEAAVKLGLQKDKV